MATWTGAQYGREDAADVVAVGHDDTADQAGGYAPGRGVDRVGVTVLRLVGDIESARKVIAKIVGGAGLQGAAVLHHRLNGEGSIGTGKALVGRLLSWQRGKCQYLFGEVRVDA